jgi:hypothetical protein
MKITSLNQTTCRSTDAVFGASSIGAGIATLCMGAMVIVAGYLTVYGRIDRFDMPRPLAGGIGLFLLLFIWLAGRTWRAARLPTNWVMRVQGNDVLIKFRSFENWPLGDSDPQVINLHRTEIDFVREAARTQVTKGTGGGTESNKRVDLEIALKDSDTSLLESALVEEATRPGWGNKRSRTKYLDNPVQVVEKGVIRITWRGGISAVRPGIKAALQELGRIVAVQDKRKEVDDFTVTALRKLGQEEQKKSLAELGAQNRIIAAETAKQLYGCSLGQAMRIVEDAMAGRETQAKG